MVEAYPPRHVERFYVRYQKDGRQQVELRVEEEEYGCVALAPGGNIGPKMLHCPYVTNVMQFEQVPRLAWVDGDQNGIFSGGDAFTFNDMPLPAWTMPWARVDFEKALGQATALLNDTATAVATALTAEPIWPYTKAEIIARTIRPKSGSTWS